MSRGPRDIITASRDREGAVMTSSDGDQLSYLDKSDMDRIYIHIIDQSKDFDAKEWPLRKAEKSRF